MTDRELLEAAAKAAGIAVLPPGRWPLGVEQLGLWIQVGEHRTAVGWWNPLTSDGDALRLAVKLGLGLGIDMQDEIVTAYAPNPSPQHFSEDAHEADHYAATRRAIVRAAAAIGGCA